MQACASDGLRIKLAAFQLNKTALHVEPKDGDHNNVLWLLPEAELASEETGAVNEDALTSLIALYLNAPTETVPSTCGVVSRDIKDDYAREEFHNKFRHLYSRRDPHLPKPEIQQYQKVQMIDNPELGFTQSYMRERPWFKLAKICFTGRANWHPEFKQLGSDSDTDVRWQNKSVFEKGFEEIKHPEWSSSLTHLFLVFVANITFLALAHMLYMKIELKNNFHRRYFLIQIGHLFILSFCHRLVLSFFLSSPPGL